MNINVEIFKKYKPENKLHMVNHLSNEELLMVRLSTIERIVKETGYGSASKARNHDKKLSLISRVGNSWNSEVEDISLYKKELYIGFYLQYENTDTSDSDKLSSFLTRGTYRGECVRDDRYGNPRTYYFNYDEEDKAGVIKAILLTYIHNKYHI